MRYPTQEESVVILPEHLRQRLERKAIEYDDRLYGVESPTRYESPEQILSRPGYAAEFYKLTIAKRLLEHGRVDLVELADELSRKFGCNNPNAYNQAAAVLKDYMQNEGTNVRGGTGF